jgi:hypothetical protein
MSNPKQFSPREYLRARRPERFSDSIAEEKPILDRSMLEYHLHTLTSRSQENDFQHFARHLAEREVCPNLLPQTGPTGGGDSKVDAETYPVADGLSFVWYVGIGQEAASERWAFAFSAKEDWRTKVHSDIDKIAQTGRGYSKAFFITNQYVRDRSRAEVEDELRQKHGFDVRILDRTWILDKVFGGQHEQLAIQDLQIQTSARTQVRKGPHDLEREQDREEVETRINAASQNGHFGFQLVNDCAEAARLARGLERPRTEVDGLFQRAERAAHEYGNQHQELTVAYDKAWTAIFWYEDYALFNDLYGDAERYAGGTHNADELELLSNLWHVLYALVRTGKLDEAASNLNVRTDALLGELRRLGDEENWPSSALHARSLLLCMRIPLSSPDERAAVFREIDGVVRQSQGLIGFPLESLAEALTEMGKYLDSCPEYDELFATIVQVVSERKGDTAAARMLLKRGAQQLDEDRPADAIRTIGRALAKLFKYETRDDIVHALCLCGAAYERVGLLWAARGTTLAAASIATSASWSDAEVTPLQAACFNRMKWIELQLGRLPHILAWHELDRGSRFILAQQGYDRAALDIGKLDFDGILGILLLRTDLWGLKGLSAIPEVLDRLSLPCAAVSLEFALGYEEKLRSEFLGDDRDDDSLQDFFLRLRDQPAGKELPAGPMLCDGRTVVFSSIIFGCKVTAETDNELPCLALGESILAALESLLSTGTVDRMVAREPTLSIRVRKSDFCAESFEFNTDDRDGRPHAEVRCGTFDPARMSREMQGAIKGKLSDFIAYIMGRTFLFVDGEQAIVKLFRDDRALERALNFTSSFVTLGNVLGDSPRTDITMWSDSSAHDYPLLRSRQWDAGTIAGGDGGRSVEAEGSNEPRRKDAIEAISAGNIRHTDIGMVSLIRESLWNEAKWKGTAFGWSENDAMPPVLGPWFENAEAAKRIFALWRTEIGRVDTQELLRVAVIRGISQENANAYRVVLGVNPAAAMHKSGGRLAIMVSRWNTMQPPSSGNLNAFLANYKAAGTYLLAHYVDSPESPGLELVLDDAISKRELHLREAWEIGRNDPESVGIMLSDHPIIPVDHPDAPVLELLRRKQKR